MIFNSKKSVPKKLNAKIEKLKYNESVLQHMLNTSKVGLCYFDTEMRYVQINDWLAKINGLTVREHLGRSIRELFPDLAAGVEPQLQKVIDTGDPVIKGNVYAETPAHPGVKRLYEHNYFADKLDNGTVVGISCFVEDITERKQAEKALGAANEQFKVAFEIANIGICLVDLSGYFTTVNKQATVLYGYSSEELEKLTFKDITHPDDKEIGLQHVKEAIEGKIDNFKVTKRYIHKDGHTIWAELSSSIVRDEEGNPLHFISCVLDITERKRAEEHLLRYQHIVSSSHDMLALLDQNFAYLAVNDRYAAAFGKKSHELIGITPSEAFGSKFFTSTIGPHADKCLQGEDVHYESWFDFPALGKRYMEVSYLPYRNADNEIKGFIVNSRDITDRKQIEDALRESENKYRTLFEQSADAILIIEGDKFVDCNSATVKMLGYKNKEELLNTHPSELSPEMQPDGKNSFTKANEILSNIFEQGSKRFEWDHLRKNGEVFPVEVLLTPVPFGERNFIHVVWRDITDRKQAEEAQQKSEEKFEKAFNSSPDSITITRLADGRIIEVNESFERISGYSRQEAVGKTSLELGLFKDPAVRDILKNILQEQSRIRDFEIEGYHKSGEIRTMHLSAELIELQGQTHLLAITRDISEIKKAEEERSGLEAHLRQQQKLESIGTLAGGVAHEINNPINGIMNYAQLIDDRLDPESPLREYAGEIVRESKRVAKIVLNLLTFARQDKEPHSPANISDNVNNTLSLIRTIIRGDQITLDVDIPDDLPKIKCRSQQIQQVIMNLLTNARDALNLRYSGHDPDKIIRVTSKLFEKEGQKWIRTTVEDHGDGISEEIGDRVFDPFFTTKDRAKGTGLGLSISHGIVSDHHGELSYESEMGKFTRFHLDLPVDNGWTLEEKQKDSK